MCLIVFDWQPGQPCWLRMAANRDEFHRRPTAPLQPWQDNPAIVAGRDLEQGGTWLGASHQGRIAALTNVRAPGAGPQQPLSRGLLPSRWLGGHGSAETFVSELIDNAGEYAPFNLLIGDQQQLLYVTNYPKPHWQVVSPGVHTMSNAALNTPWPKTRLASKQILQLDQCSAQTLAHLLDRRQPWPDQELPATGVPPEWERMLSAQFIVSPAYGTRCSTGLVATEQSITLHEISWNAAGEQQASNEQQLTLLKRDNHADSGG